ncbi:MAG: hypothetical protein AAF530_19280 [Pseudomonadota bacterium]
MAAKINENLGFKEFKLQSCTVDEDGSRLFFSASDQSSRHFSVSHVYNKVFIGFSGGKGAVDFDNVERVTYLQMSEMEGYISIHFKEPMGLLTSRALDWVEFGVADLTCWNKLTENLGGKISTEII